jgi:hypothetical protein
MGETWFPPCCLEEYLEREVLRAASLEQLHGAVKIDVRSGGELRGVGRCEARALEFTLPPALHSVVLVLLPRRCLECLHAISSVPLYPFFGGLDVLDLPKEGELPRIYEPLTVAG